MSQRSLYLSFPASASQRGRQLERELREAKVAVATRDGLRRKGVEERIAEAAFFLACFGQSDEGPAAYSAVELELALARLEKIPADQRWLIPVKLERCEFPPLAIGDGDMIGDLSPIDLTSDWDAGVEELLRGVGGAKPLRRVGSTVDSIHAGRDANISDSTVGRVVSDRDTNVR